MFSSGLIGSQGFSSQTAFTDFPNTPGTPTLGEYASSGPPPPLSYQPEQVRHLFKNTPLLHNTCMSKHTGAYIHSRPFLGVASGHSDEHLFSSAHSVFFFFFFFND